MELLRISTCQGSGGTAIFRPSPEVRAAADVRSTAQGTRQVTPQVPDKYPASTRQVLTALAKAGEPLTRTALQEISGLRNREHFVNEHLSPLVEVGLIEMTIPDRPRSSKQGYRLTRAVAEYLKKMQEKK